MSARTLAESLSLFTRQLEACTVGALDQLEACELEALDRP